jgi:hypothetical protein
VPPGNAQEVRFDLHTMVVKADNGPEKCCRSTQFVESPVDFARTKKVGLEPAYYPPYRDKYHFKDRICDNYDLIFIELIMS